MKKEEMICGKSKVTLYQGDCLELMRELPNQSVDLILCDLPYGTTAGRWDEVLPFEQLWEHYKRLIKPEGNICLFASGIFSSIMVTSNLEMFLYRWIWDKKQGANWQLAKRQPLNITEDINVFSHSRAANGAKMVARYQPLMELRDTPIKSGGVPNSSLLNPHKMKALKKTYTTRYPTNILSFKKPSSKERIHPTQKPIELLKYLIKTYTSEGDLVLDNCMGSGTTGVASITLERNFVGMELDPSFFEKSIDFINSKL